MTRDVSEFRIGDWDVRSGEGTLCHQQTGEVQRVEPKAMEVLVLLAESSGRTVTRTELLDQVWSDTLGTDEVLSRIISVLRKLLGDDTRSPTYIETVPKLGYRLVAVVEPLPAGPVNARVPSRKILLPLIASVGLAVLVGLGIWLLEPDSPEVSEPWLSSLVPSENLQTLAVVPFEDLSEDANYRYFSDGLTDELITALAQRERLRVVARRSVLNLDGSGYSRMPSVQYVLSGTSKFTQQGIRITAQLSDQEGFVQWSSAYEGGPGDFVTLQREVTTALVMQLSEELGLSVPQVSPVVQDVDAYAFYLNGRFLWKRRGEQSLNASIGAFEQALQRAPDFGDAHLGLAASYVLLPYYSDALEADSFPRAIDEIEKLTNPTARQAAEVDAIRAFIAFREWRWLDADRLFRKSLEQSPELANTWTWYSQFLSAVGQPTLALQAAEQAFVLDAVSPVIIDRLATANLWMNNTEAASALYSRSAGYGFTNLTNPGFINMLLRQERWDLIRQAFAEPVPGDHFRWILDNLPHLSVREYRAQFEHHITEGLKNGQVHPRLELGLWTHVRHPERALESIAKNLGDKRNVDVEFLFSPEAAVLRAHPSFRGSLETMGIDAYWALYPPGISDLSWF
ncbi:MAG: winged helix-turn-helix domain-containing protein [Pseudomonadota bacterium]